MLSLPLILFLSQMLAVNNQRSDPNLNQCDGWRFWSWWVSLSLSSPVRKVLSFFRKNPAFQLFFLFSSSCFSALPPFNSSLNEKRDFPCNPWVIDFPFLSLNSISKRAASDAFYSAELNLHTFSLLRNSLSSRTKYSFDVASAKLSIRLSGKFCLWVPASLTLCMFSYCVSLSTQNSIWIQTTNHTSSVCISSSLIYLSTSLSLSLILWISFFRFI